MTFWTVTVLYFQLWHTRLLKYFRLTTWFNKRSPTETHYGRAGKRPRGTSGQGLPVWRLPVANAKRPDKYLNWRLTSCKRGSGWFFHGGVRVIHVIVFAGGGGGLQRIWTVLRLIVPRKIQSMTKINIWICLRKCDLVREQKFETIYQLAKRCPNCTNAAYKLHVLYS